MYLLFSNLYTRKQAFVKPYSHILFDLDGTLTDPQEGIINSIQYALKRFGVKKENHELLHFIGPPLHKSFQEIFITEEKAFEAVAVYREYYATKGIFENVLFDGITDLLKTLNDNGKSVFMATSKPQLFAEQIATHFNIKNYFKGIVGSNMDGTLTDKKEIIAEVLKLAPSIAIENMVMIGDRKFDMIGANYFKMDTIAVTFGYGSLEELKNEQPTYILNKVSDLYALLV